MQMKIFIKKKKRFVTLLETLIALSLLTVLLTIIFGFFQQMTTISNLTEIKQGEAFKLRYLEARLAFFFERIINEKEKTKREFYFYIDPTTNGQSHFPSLVFTFDNEIRLDPLFSSDVIGRLYVDHEHNLCLASWPILAANPSHHMQKEVLMENVEALSFQLYSPPEHLDSRTFIATPEIDPKKPLYNHWYINEWPMVFQKMPAIIKIYLTVKVKKGENEEWEFAFVLPTSQSNIYYPPN